MDTREYRIRFVVPAFLGNADQNGQWRSPPFKALLRQWWRVAYAAERKYPVDTGAMRQEEGRLFGAAADGAGSRSLVRLRLGHWNMGELQKRQWSPLGAVSHPEVKQPVDAGLYLGYGPTVWSRQDRAPTLKANAAIQAQEQAALRLAFPGTDAESLDTALALVARYGTLGGRSRNGWGSFELASDTHAIGTAQTPLRDWRECLDRDWPHAIGRDSQGALIWHTEAADDWTVTMRRLAEIKIGLRTQFAFPSERPPHAQVQPRHWLSYPVTKHSTRQWNNNARLPNSLRFKVRAGAEGLRGVIFHVPCLPPPQFKPDRKAIEEVWQKVYRYLDGEKLERIPA